VDKFLDQNRHDLQQPKDQKSVNEYGEESEDQGLMAAVEDE
jgi:hypothetical protein